MKITGWRSIGLFTLAVALVGVLAAGVWWQQDGPRHLLERILSSRLAQPVRLAHNPQFSATTRALQISLPGLGVGPAARPCFTASRLTLTLATRPLLAGQIQLRKLSMERPQLRLPCPSPGGSSSSGALIWPASVSIDDGTILWQPAGRSPITISRLQARIPAAGQAMIQGHWQWQKKAGTVEMNASGGPFLGSTLHWQDLRISADSKPGQAAHARIAIAQLDLDRGRLQLPRLVASLHWHGQTAQVRAAAVAANLRAGSLQIGDWQMDLGRYGQMGGQLEKGQQSPLQGSMTFHADLHDLPQLAHNWGFHFPSLRDPNALQTLSFQGQGQVRDGRFLLSMNNGILDQSHWSGQMAGQWQPWQIHLNLQLDQLDLGHYLPPPAPGKAMTLPPLPQQWPITGQIRIDRLRWGQIRATGVLIRSTSGTRS
ncbi:MAG: AsmA family protein [Acidithiobacillus sp.]